LGPEDRRRKGPSEGTPEWEHRIVAAYSELLEGYKADAIGSFAALERQAAICQLFAALSS
jgi:hypothetical protein